MSSNNLQHGSSHLVHGSNGLVYGFIGPTILPTDTQVFYGGEEIVADIGYIRSVGDNNANISFGEKWQTNTTYTLSGYIFGCTAEDIFTLQQTLAHRLRKDYQTLSIIDTEGTAIEVPLTRVASIAFDSSRYIGFVPFTITIEAIPEDLFEGEYGVTEPSDEWSFSEDLDGTVEVTHTVSARGLNTDSENNNALTNAKNFVESRLGFDPNAISTIFFSSDNLEGRTPNERTAQSNRFEGTHSATETYRFDKNGVANDPTILRYEIDIERNPEGFWELGIDGDFRGDQDVNFETLRTQFNNIDFEVLADDAYNSLNPAQTWNLSPVNFSTTENKYEREISFSYTYDNNPNGNVWKNESVEVSQERDKITVTVSGNIEGRNEQGIRWPAIVGFFSSLNAFATADSAYEDYFSTLRSNDPLRSDATSKSVTKNEVLGTLNYSYTYLNETAYQSDVTQEFEYTVNIEKNPEQFLQVGISGTYTGKQNEIATLAELRSALNDALGGGALWSEVKNLAHDAYTQMGGTSSLKDLPLTQNSTENFNDRVISFNATFDDNPKPSAWLNYTVEINDEEDDPTVSVSGVIEGLGHRNERLANLDAALASLNMLSLATTEVAIFLPSETVRPNPTSRSITRSPFGPSITFSATFEIGPPISSEFKDLEYTLQFTPTRRKIAKNYIIDGQGRYYLVDTGINTRREEGITGSAQLAEGVTMAAGRGAVETLINQYVDGNLTSKSITEDLGNRSLNFSVSWDKPAGNPVALYAEILTLT